MLLFQNHFQFRPWCEDTTSTKIYGLNQGNITDPVEVSWELCWPYIIHFPIRSYVHRYITYALPFFRMSTTALLLQCTKIFWSVTNHPRCLRQRLWQIAPSRWCSCLFGQVTPPCLNPVFLTSMPTSWGCQMHQWIETWMAEVKQFVCRVYCIPFQVGRKASHQYGSRYASVYILRWWYRHDIIQVRSMKWQKLSSLLGPPCKQRRT